jgi:hypothetical protein
MFGPISRLLNALTALAGNVEGLAGTVAQIDRGLQDRLGLSPVEAPAVEGTATPAVAVESSVKGKRGR